METVLVRDKKKVPKGGFSSVVRFTFASLIQLPVILFVVLPVGFTVELVRTVVTSPFSLLKSKKKTTKKDDKDKYKLPEIDVEKQVPLESRAYDIVLYGCTGFTGRLAASYLAKNYGDGNLKWAIAGRRASRLEEIRKELVSETNNSALLESIGIIVADSSKEETLHDLVSNTRVVISTVGPYLYYGTPVVKYCVAYGTSYADITGEIHWVRDMIFHFQEDAKRTGARIVSLCGNDCIPWDLLAKLLVDKLKAESDVDVKSFEFFNDMGGAVSGGTIATVLSALSLKTEGHPGGDPMNLLPSGSQSDNRLSMSKAPVIGYSKTSKSWHSSSFMARVNYRCVQRSNALLGYGKKVSYFEVNNQPNWFSARQTTIDLLTMGTFIVVRSLRELAFSLGLVPLPGQGPSKETQESGYLRVHGFVKGEDGSEVDGYIYFPQDPGYSSTARMVVESGLCLVLHADELPVKGGFWSPAAGLGNVLKDRLEKTGTEFQV